MIGKYKILILGIAGYLGSRFASAVDQSKYEIYGTLNQNIPEVTRANQIYEQLFIGDLTVEKNWIRLSKYRYDYIVNFISLDHKQSEIQKIEKVEAININIIDKIFRLLDLSNCKCIINLSSVQVYGPTNGNSFMEQSIISPKNMYGLSHSFKEQMLNYYAEKHTTNAINLRLSNVFGPPLVINDSFLKLVFNDFCFNAIKHKKIVIQSDGTPFRDFIYIEDFINAIKFFMTNSSFDYNTFNLVSSRSISLLHLANKIKDESKNLFNYDVSIDIKNKVDAFDYDKKLVQYDNRLVKSTGFNFTHDFESGLKDFLLKLNQFIKN